MKTENLDLREYEEMLDERKGDTWKTPEMAVRRQVSGRFYFTNQRVSFRTWGPFKKASAYDIEYSDIASLDTFSINLVIKTGIQITTKSGDVYKISVLKRNDCMQIMNQYIN